MKRYLITIAFLAVALFMKAQDRSHFYTNTLNPFLQNPAYAGSYENIYTIFNARTMIGGIENSNRNYNFGIHSPISANTGGVGLKFVSDQRGAFQTVNAEMAYSKRVRFSEKHSLSLGLSVGFLQNNLKSELLNGQVDLTDPSLNNPDLNRVKFVSGAGVLYKIGKTFDLGVSFPMLATGSAQLDQTMLVSSGLNFFIGKNDSWKLRPFGTYYKLERSPELIDGGLQLAWNNTIHLQGIYRTNGTNIYSAGLQVKSFGVWYSYYSHTGSLKNLAPAQNELAITFAFNKPQPRKADKAEMDPQQVQDELDHINTRLNGLLEVEKTNPGLVNVKKELTKLNSELDKILRKYKITNPEQIKKVREMQDLIDTLVSKYSK